MSNFYPPPRQSPGLSQSDGSRGIVIGAPLFQMQSNRTILLTRFCGGQ